MTRINDFHTDGVWPQITMRVKRTPNRCMVAVAYFGKGASKMLPLEQGSTLIVDMSKAAVGSGQTHPKDILKLVKGGVDVHSVQNLHAKVFVIDNRAYVGSNNASNHSAANLIEAAIETSDRSVVASCRRFVKSLRGELVTQQHAVRMQRFYKDPKLGTFTGRANGATTKAPIPAHPPLWIVPLINESWDDEDYDQEDKGMPRAKSKLRSTRRYRVDDFLWESSEFLNRISNGDNVMQCTKEGANRFMVSPISRVLDIRRYTKGRSKCAIVYLERAKRTRRKNLRMLVNQVGPRVKTSCMGSNATRERDASFVHALMNLWP